MSCSAAKNISALIPVIAAASSKSSSRYVKTDIIRNRLNRYFEPICFLTPSSEDAMKESHFFVSSFSKLPCSNIPDMSIMHTAASIIITPTYSSFVAASAITMIVKRAAIGSNIRSCFFYSFNDNLNSFFI